MADFIKIDGLREVEQALIDLANTTKPATAKAVIRRNLTRRLTPMRDTARSRAPVDKGYLRDSIKIGPPNPRNRPPFDGPVQIQVAMGPTKDGYPEAMPQEMGTEKMPAHPYMRPAWEEHKGELLPGIAQDLMADINKAAQRAAARTKRLQKNKG